MDRRGFVTAVAALGASATLPNIATAAESHIGWHRQRPSHVEAALRMATLRNETTRQFTTFNLDRKSKTIAIPKGKRVTIGEVKGEGYVTQFWLTFPGWFWQHWNTKTAVNQSILKTLILRIYFDGAEKPAVAAPVGDFFGARAVRSRQLCFAVMLGTSSGDFSASGRCRSARVSASNWRTSILRSTRMCSATFSISLRLCQRESPISTPNSTPASTKVQSRLQIAEATDAGTTPVASSTCRAKIEIISSFSKHPNMSMWTATGKTALRWHGAGRLFPRRLVFPRRDNRRAYHGVTIKDTLNSMWRCIAFTKPTPSGSRATQIRLRIRGRPTG